MKIQTLASIIAFSIITTSMAQASTQDNIIEVNNHTSIRTTYKNMTIAQLQEAVEKHSAEGTLSFELGHALMKRWTNGQIVNIKRS